MWASVKGRKRCVVVAQGCVPSSLHCTPKGHPELAGTMNGSRRARNASHILRGTEINGSCCSPGCTTRSHSRVSWASVAYYNYVACTAVARPREGVAVNSDLLMVAAVAHRSVRTTLDFHNRHDGGE
jgi:hypothetical protein